MFFLSSSFPGRAGSVFMSLAAIFGLASCNVFDGVSGDLACSVNSDCDSPRTCESGFCIVPAELLPDADPSLPDADPTLPDVSTIPTPDAGPCNSIQLFDDFTDGVATPSWTTASASGISVMEAVGVLTISAPSLPAVTGEAGYISVMNSYVLTNSEFSVEVPAMVDVGSMGSASLLINGGSSNTLEFTQRKGTLNINLSVAGVASTVASVAYTAAQNRWWRVVDAGGNFSVQTSPDGLSWVTHGTAPTPTFFGAVGVELTLRAFNTGTVPGSVVFDNVNGGAACTP